MRWVNSPYNLDDFFQSFLVFFMLVTGEAWDTVFQSAVNAVGIDMQPQSWANPWSSLAMFGFALVTNILISNLFVGVVIDNFKETKEEQSQFRNLSQNQKDWVDMQLFMQRRDLKVKFFEPENRIRSYCYRIAQSPYFQPFIIFVILFNTIILGANSASMSQQVSIAFTILNDVFLGFFHIEALIKICAWGMVYFKDNWNRYHSPQDLSLYLLLI